MFSVNENVAHPVPSIFGSHLMTRDGRVQMVQDKVVKLGNNVEDENVGTARETVNPNGYM